MASAPTLRWRDPSIPIHDLARSEVVTATEEASIAELARTMRERVLGSVVITDGDSPVGIVTDRDLVMRVLAEETSPADQTARDVMPTAIAQSARTRGSPRQQS